MSLVTKIKDGYGKDNFLKINGEGEVSVVVHTHPPDDEGVSSLPFRQYFTDDGTSAGDNDMRVNGSTNNVDFYIKADNEYDIYIKTLSVKLADAGAAFNEFGNLSSLTNGVQIEWFSQSLGDFEIHDGIKDNLEWFRLSKQTPTIIDLSGGGADAVLTTIDMGELFGNPWGVRLKQNSTEKLILRVRDNLSTGIDEFNVIGYGVKV